MKAMGFIAALSIATGLLANSAGATIVYEVNRVVGNGSVNGTITTDGTLGNLSLSNCDAFDCAPGGENILDWDLTLNDGSGSFRLFQGNSGLAVQGADPRFGTTNFWATPDNLFWDFTAVGYAQFRWGDLGAVGPLWYLGFEDGNIGTEVVYSGPNDFEEPDWRELERIRILRTQTREWSTKEIIGSAVSVAEPGALVLLILGLTGLSCARRIERS